MAERLIALMRWWGRCVAYSSITRTRHSDWMYSDDYPEYISRERLRHAASRGESEAFHAAFDK